MLRILYFQVRLILSKSDIDVICKKQKTFSILTRNAQQ
jgi:hypothetical protein